MMAIMKSLTRSGKDDRYNYRNQEKIFSIFLVRKQPSPGIQVLFF